MTLTLPSSKKILAKTFFDFRNILIRKLYKKERKLRPSKESLNRFARRARQLYEQGACVNIILSYAQRYYSYLHAGLKFSVTLQKLQKYLKFLDHKFGLYLSA